VFYLGFAGDGEQTIFKREALFAESVFAEHFSADDHAVELINDSDDRDSYPIASVSGLQQALKLMASRMDLEQDVLVLMLTSHGSREGLEVANGSLPLVQLSPVDLQQALDESGIKWRIVVVSACYSGVFVDALKSDHTLVITAADADHSSFGCDDERDLTYFGEAFLKDSILTTASLEEAFRKAAALIQRREGGEHKVRSNPQMAMGAQMRAKLAGLEGGTARRSGRATVVSNHWVAAMPTKDSVPRAVPLSIVILAAGQGKRMKSDLPKVLQPLAGRPLLKHVIDTARTLGASAIHVVYGHGGDLVRQALKDEEVSWALQAERLGTGHAVMQAIPKIPDDHVVLVLYGDVPLISNASLSELLRLCGPKQISLLTVMLDDPSGYGRVIRNGRDHVLKIVEEKDATPKELQVHECNTGLLAAPAKLLRKWLKELNNDNSQREYYLTDIIALAVADKVVVAPLVAPDMVEVLGVNDKAQLAEVEAAYRRRTARELMLAGVTVADPARLDVRGAVSHGHDVFLDINVVLEGKVKLGNRVRVGPNCVIRNSEIGDDTEVFAHCVIDSAVIGASCNIGPFARFRPVSTLGQGVHIGNFVEVKNSQMGNDSKANHLAYVGDALVGQRVNIGAGTIIANYDGANKHRTIIENDVHTGSNSVLVAPITVGAGATIGAGSTVAKEVPPAKLTVARAKQVTIDNWQRPTKTKK